MNSPCGCPKSICCEVRKLVPIEAVAAAAGVACRLSSSKGSSRKLSPTADPPATLLSPPLLLLPLLPLLPAAAKVS